MYNATNDTSMLEIEVKVPVESLAVVEKRLLQLNANLVGEKDQQDVYYAHPSKDFGSTDEALRLRSDGTKRVLTYKGPKLDSRSKTREEIEFPVDTDLMGTVLERLGFVRFIKIVKVRKVYLLGDVEVSLDKVEGLGEYVELEFSGQDAEAGLRRIEEVKEALGIAGNETRSYLELLLEKKK